MGNIWFSGQGGDETPLVLWRVGLFVFWAMGFWVLSGDVCAQDVDKKGPSVLLAQDKAKEASGGGDDLLVVSQELPLLRWMIGRLPQVYVDPSQFDPAKMYRAVLERLAYQVREVWVDFSMLPSGKYTVHVGPHHKTFSMGSFFGILDVWVKAQKVMLFIKQHYRGPVSAFKMDYYAVQGLLSTLDRQTRLVDIRGQRKGPSLAQTGMIGIFSEKRDKKLLIRRVYPDSPADQAGLQSNDQIVKINGGVVRPDETMLQLSRRLRGLRGTRLALHILRKGWSAPKRFVLIRAMMQSPLVVGYMLPGKIAYIRLRQFDGGAAAAIREEMGRLRRQIEGNFLGLILDLRYNPGGRVTEAVEICSMFVERGDVVSFVGSNIPRKTYRVTGRNTEEKYPLALLLNGRSASASELLAGALQMHNRAVILGRQSYGKGTVQSAGLTLGGRFYMAVTIAQYLLPGDNSIQGVGIRPDIELVPVKIDKQEPQYFRSMLSDIEDRKKRWPRFLQQNLELQRGGVRRLMFLDRHATNEKKMTSNTKASAKNTSSKTRKRLKLKRKKKRAKKNMKKRTDDVWKVGGSPEALRGDFDVWFARYLLSHVSSGRRDVVLQQAEKAFQHVRQQEELSIIRSLRKVGIDWSVSKTKSPKKVRLEAKVELIAKKISPQAGEDVRLRLSVKNNGSSPAYRVHAVVFSKLRPFQHRELLFGKLMPQKTLVREIKVKIPSSYSRQPQMLRIKIEADGAEKTAPLSLKLPIHAPPLPVLRTGFQILDRAPDGNQDGRLQPGEKAFVRIFLENTRPLSVSKKMRVALVVLGARVQQTVQEVGRIEAKKRYAVEFSVKIPDAAKPGTLSAIVQVHDPETGFLVMHRLSLPVSPALPGLPERLRGWAVFSKETALWGAPGVSRLPSYRAFAGARLAVVARLAGFVQVRLSDALWFKKVDAKKGSKRWARGAFAWVREQDVRLELGRPGKEQLKVEPVFAFEPPTIHLPDQDRLVWTKSSSYPLPIEFKSLFGLRDVYVLLGKKKVFFQNVQHNKPKGKISLKVKAMIPLKEGSNHIKIVARTGRGRFVKRVYLYRQTEKPTKSIGLSTPSFK